MQMQTELSVSAEAVSPRSTKGFEGGRRDAADAPRGDPSPAAPTSHAQLSDPTWAAPLAGLAAHRFSPGPFRSRRCRETANLQTVAFGRTI